MFPLSFRRTLRVYSTYHRITPWLIGFILGYFLHKYQHLATSSKLEELRNRKVTWRKVRAIGTPLTNCQCYRAACLASQHKKIWDFSRYSSVHQCDILCFTSSITTTISIHMYTNLLFRHYNKIRRNIYIYIRVGLYIYPPSGPHRARNGNSLLIYICIYTCAEPHTWPLNTVNLTI